VCGFDYSARIVTRDLVFLRATAYML